MKVTLSSSELRVMEEFWRRGRLSIREVQEAYPGKKRPPYTSVQGTVNRLEEKGALRRVRKIGNAHIYEAAMEAQEGRKRLLEDLLRVFGGRAQTVMAHLAESGQLTRQDIEATGKLIDRLERKVRSEEEES